MRIDLLMSMAQRDIPDAHHTLLALLMGHVDMVRGACDLLAIAVDLPAAASAELSQSRHRAGIGMRAVRTSEASLRKIVGAKAVINETKIVRNLAMRLRDKPGAYASEIAVVLERFDDRVPNLTAVRDGFAHIDDRASKEFRGMSDAGQVLFGLRGLELRVRGRNGELVTFPVSPETALACERLLEELIEVYPKRPDYDAAMADINTAISSGIF